MRYFNKKGFSLIETIVAIGVFVMFAVGIYEGIQMIYKIVYRARMVVLENGVLNEEIELMRNIAYADVGIVGGSPAGIFTRVATTTRNGIDFTVTRTIRSVDDPSDGTIGGSPNDTSPADYKLAQVEVACASCRQQKSLFFSTRITPRYLETTTNNGSLLVQVFDASAHPIAGATVHITAPTVVPAIDLTDTTNANGMLSIVDLPPGNGAYNIEITKSGYTENGTLASTQAIPNPINPPISVVAQNVVSVSYMIDKVSALAVSTIGSACEVIPNATVAIKGTQLWGINPDVYKVNTNFTTNAVGSATLSSYIWDVYLLTPSGYDIKGAIPMVPVNILPGVTQPVQLILGANTTYSLLVSVVDDATGQPISDASVRVVSAAPYDDSKITGAGYIRQTDWSGGSGQAVMVNAAKYFSDSGAVDATGSPGNLRLKKSGSNYLLNGWLESSIFDLGVEAHYISFLWQPMTQPVATGADPVRWQLATSVTSTPPTWDYLGPDGTATTYYTANDLNISAVNEGNRFARYKLFLRTASNKSTPLVSDMTISYTNSCTPPGQVYFGTITANTHQVYVSATGYQNYASEITVDGDEFFTIRLAK
ncbi:MAG: prepilin-type N-terminal cleavage/methylation domain-containing protein [Patescibacteria group bacterium]